jgi:hypothetical protein
MGEGSNAQPGFNRHVMSLSHSTCRRIRAVMNITGGGDMKILAQLLLTSVVIAYFGFIGIAQAEPY